MARTYIVRYGATRLLGRFTAKDPETRFRRDMDVVARTDRGLEVAHVLEEANGDGGPGGNRAPRGQILRRMTDDDRREYERLVESTKAEFETCQHFVERRKLPMQLVDVEHLFGGERIIFYFLADGRIDFRELVKDLAREYQTRIEMRQIGVRDEAKLLADFGDCGLPCCCRSHMREMPPVSMKMAKMQKATLDPAKISGRCGRLKCCLRFEDAGYERLRKELPEVGMRVRTEAGVGEVIGQEILAQRVTVEFEDRRRQAFESAEILERLEMAPRSGSSRRRRSGRGKGSRGSSDGRRGQPNAASKDRPSSGPKDRPKNPKGSGGGGKPPPS